jgi:hypothetical protein
MDEIQYCKIHPGAEMTSEMLCEGCYAETQFGDEFMADEPDDG